MEISRDNIQIYINNQINIYKKCGDNLILLLEKDNLLKMLSETIIEVLFNIYLDC